MRWPGKYQYLLLKPASCGVTFAKAHQKSEPRPFINFFCNQLLLAGHRNPTIESFMMTSEQNKQQALIATPITPKEFFSDRRIIDFIEIDPQAQVRLNGQNSLYETCQNACLEQGEAALSPRFFNKKVEAVLEYHLKISFFKKRDQKGTYFVGFTIKPSAPPPDSVFAVTNQSFTFANASQYT